jgi:23S rRNA (uracil1939-C5)-methyltransferase
VGNAGLSRSEAAVEVGTVTAMTHEGEGVIREGKAVFVLGALPGERIRFQRTKRHRQHDEGRLIEIIEPAPERVAPRCAHFGVCGGCSLQHLSAESQLAFKQAQLREGLERIAKVIPETWLPPLNGPQWGYRRRARLGAKYVTKKGRGVVGFRERLAPYIAALERCHVLAPPVGELIEPLSQLLTSLHIRERLPQIEVAVADNAVALVLRVLEDPTEDDLNKLRAFESQHQLRFYLQRGGLDTVRRLDPAPVDEPPLHYALPHFGLELEFTPTDFVQINGAINAALAERAVELLELTPQSRVLDLFCGLGNFTLPLARHAAHVVGVEGDAQLIARARHNAQRNGLANAEFHVANLAAAVPEGVSWLRQAYTHVVLDPPRAGAREMLPTLAHFRPQRVLYISCHPGSLARDIGLLVHDHGFKLRAAGVLDMFPHTAHVESIALLEPAKS